MIVRLAIAALLLAPAVPAMAAGQDERPSPGAGQDDAGHGAHLMPLSKVILMLQSKVKGQYINTTVGDQGGRPAYFTQWRMPNGRMVVLIVDAETGAMIGRQGG
ncbi:MAG: hypothetical protein E7812_08030 [Phenylobacterium sp.]|nr:MAG: hypothetical protein E7812_08030 [Phenylobacterium sp.]